jgi:plasmid stability protein
MIQIRNVPDTLHRKLKARAAVAGKSLSDYLLAEALDASLITCDGPLGAAPGVAARVEVIR